MRVVLKSTKRKLFFEKRVFKPYEGCSIDLIREIEERIGFSIPADLAEWLLEMGFGDINEELCFRKNWFVPVLSGRLKGAAFFAQDLNGGFYAICPLGRVYYFTGFDLMYAFVANGFSEFMGILVEGGFEVLKFSDGLCLSKYDWDDPE